MKLPARVIFLGSGAFGLPTLHALLEHVEVPLVITQPPRGAGRGRAPQPTPVHALAAERGIAVITPASVREPAVLEQVAALKPDALVVIAYGGKLPPELLDARFAINLHASLLPAWRGAAPIHRAIIAGDRESGVSVIALAQVMDAGVVYARRATPIGEMETAGELHDRLALMGPEVVLDVLHAHAEGRAQGQEQDPALVSHAAKLRKEEGTTEFGGDARAVVRRIHGLTPWPGCTVDAAGKPLRLLRVQQAEQSDAPEPGAIDAQGIVRCGRGAVRLLEVQPAGGRAMSCADYLRGHRGAAGVALKPWTFRAEGTGDS